MFCKLYIHCDSIENLIYVLEKEFGKMEKKRHSQCKFKEFEIDILHNDNADKNKLHIYPDGFLYYELLGEFESENNYVQITDRILRLLWKYNIPTVASCDYEDEINKLALEK